jgi:hypothetical protein
MVCSTIFQMFSSTLGTVFGTCAHNTIDPQAQREGRSGHWLAYPGHRYGQAQGSPRGDPVEDVNTFGLSDDELKNNGSRVVSILLLYGLDHLL